MPQPVSQCHCYFTSVKCKPVPSGAGLAAGGDPESGPPSDGHAACFQLTETDHMAACQVTVYGYRRRTIVTIDALALDLYRRHPAVIGWRAVHK